ncbi:hypothetical protein BYT27DRAFT_7305603 [Phlegmacium glaucopus]|nr:hypothetical protein BYT27DRAFT_7305603 [Phlegmacium glaucopus]
MTTDSEETPLLSSKTLTHGEVYQRFTPARKRWIVVIISVTGLLPYFVTGTLVPSIPQVAKDLNSTDSVVGFVLFSSSDYSLAVSLSVLATCLGSLLGASYSSFYGRKHAYLMGTPLLFVGRRFTEYTSANDMEIYTIYGSLTWTGYWVRRYRKEAILVGPSLAPFFGDFATHYYSWRIMQLAFGVIGLLLFLAILLLFPETYHPGLRGVDKIDPDLHPRWRPVLLNPLQPLWLLRSPNLLAVTLAGFVTLLIDYVSKSARYNIKNEALIGAYFLPVGLGNMMFQTRIASKVQRKVLIEAPTEELQAMSLVNGLPHTILHLVSFGNRRPASQIDAQQ